MHAGAFHLFSAAVKLLLSDGRFKVQTSQAVSAREIDDVFGLFLIMEEEISQKLKRFSASELKESTKAEILDSLLKTCSFSGVSS